eukprot:c23872_g1_i1.p1 GENE.c23872_g1_i1~~c23872_g1_i1.p1  ORF type:complete len:208 (-),score=51.99 c23872_g1_i1:435-1058(-)
MGSKLTPAQASCFLFFMTLGSFLLVHFLFVAPMLDAVDNSLPADCQVLGKVVQSHVSCSTSHGHRRCTTKYRCVMSMNYTDVDGVSHVGSAYNTFNQGYGSHSSASSFCDKFGANTHLTCYYNIHHHDHVYTTNEPNYLYFYLYLIPFTFILISVCAGIVFCRERRAQHQQQQNVVVQPQQQTVDPDFQPSAYARMTNEGETAQKPL